MPCKILKVLKKVFCMKYWRCYAKYAEIKTVIERSRNDLFLHDNEWASTTLSPPC